MRASSFIISDHRTGKEAYIKQASAGSHHEPSLVKVGDTGGIVVRLSVIQVRTRIRHVHHSGKIRVPRAPLHWSYLVAAIAAQAMVRTRMTYLVDHGGGWERCREIGTDGS